MEHLGQDRSAPMFHEVLQDEAEVLQQQQAAYMQHAEQDVLGKRDHADMQVYFE